MRDTQQILQMFQGQKDLLSAFLKQQENQRDMKRLIETPSMSRFRELNHRFQQFCFECRFIHYMSKFIYFQSINIIRKIRRHQSPLLADMEGEMVEAVHEEPINQIVEKEFGCPVLDNAVNKLTKRQRKIIRLHYQEGWKLKRIAESFHVTPQSISKTHRRALEDIKMWMEGEKHA
ncbi:sigma-70 family RNA polymerase sigma factor [Pseudalkalibacillus sp. SCS-8]|uniref:sigma-70 family RNA polymerase sigma factor n=1 Tax=Pseudalkalibacillus nanhaiensis TaxID=3115291 RepID=UPI0032DBD867